MHGSPGHDARQDFDLHRTIWDLPISVDTRRAVLGGNVLRLFHIR